MDNKEILQIKFNYNCILLSLKWYINKYVNGFDKYLVWNLINSHIWISKHAQIDSQMSPNSKYAFLIVNSLSLSKSEYSEVLIYTFAPTYECNTKENGTKTEKGSWTSLIHQSAVNVFRLWYSMRCWPLICFKGKKY